MSCAPLPSRARLVAAAGALLFGKIETLLAGFAAASTPPSTPSPSLGDAFATSDMPGQRIYVSAGLVVVLVVAWSNEGVILVVVFLEAAGRSENTWLYWQRTRPP